MQANHALQQASSEIASAEHRALDAEQKVSGGQAILGKLTCLPPRRLSNPEDSAATCHALLVQLLSCVINLQDDSLPELQFISHAELWY